MHRQIYSRAIRVGLKTAQLSFNRMKTLLWLQALNRAAHIALFSLYCTNITPPVLIVDKLMTAVQVVFRTFFVKVKHRQCNDCSMTITAKIKSDTLTGVLYLHYKYRSRQVRFFKITCLALNLKTTETSSRMVKMTINLYFLMDHLLYRILPLIGSEDKIFRL